MKKENVKNLVRQSGRQDVVIASFTNADIPGILLANAQTIYLETFRIKLALMRQNDVFAIGRGLTCDFITSSRILRISRLHCYIEKCADDLYRVHDVSLYGTTILKREKKKTFKEHIKTFFANL